MQYYIYLTNECNLMCEYCNVLVNCSKNIPIKVSYKPQELIDFIRLTQEKYVDNEVNVYFFGGEPTLEYELMSTIILQTKHDLSNYKLLFILHTNGLLLNTIPSKILFEIDIYMLSVNYEKIPKFNLSNGYFNTIIGNAISIKNKTSAPLIARLTITEKTSLYTVVLQTLNFFDYVYWQIVNCDYFENFDVYFETYKLEIELTFNYWYKFFEQGYLLKLIPFISIVRFMLYNDKPNNEFGCGYGKNMVYIQTNGNCYSCCEHTKKTSLYIGNLNEGIQFNNVNVMDIKCKKCKYIKVCKGRCGKMHKEYSIIHITKYCALNKVIFDLFYSKKEKIKKILFKFPHLKNELFNNIMDATEFTS